MGRAAALLLAALALPGCAGPREAPPLPPLAAAGPGAPARNAILGAADAFAHPEALVGYPARSLVALARLEWLAAAVPVDLTFTNFSSITGPALGAARAQAREAAGIRADAPTAPVLAALDAAAEALLRPGGEGQARAILAPPLFATDALDRVGHLPVIPQAVGATARARHDLEFGRDDDLLAFGGGWGRR